MKSEKAGVTGKGVIILGAGASRGEHFASSSADLHVLPPLDRDFFAQAQRVSSPDEGTRRLLKVARQLFGAMPSCTMEEFFTTAEFLEGFANMGRLELDAVHPFRYGVAKVAFKAALLRVLEEAGVAAIDDGARRPVLHAQLFGALEPGDAVLSFNYDVLADHALMQRYPWRWLPAPKGDLTVRGDTDFWHTYTPTGRGGPLPEVYLLKMHGSLNWVIEADAVVLTTPPFDFNRMAIIPPAWSKNIEGGDVFTRIWRDAVDFLLSAEVLAIAGYALPKTDMWAQALLRYSSTVRADEGRPFDTVLVANPDTGAAERLIGLISPAVGHGTRVVCLAGMEELASFMA